MHIHPRYWLAAVLPITASVAMPLCAQEAGEVVVKRGNIAEDVYVAGRSVDVAAEVQGDVAAAGQRVSIDSVVSGDVLAAGETVTVQANVQDDVRAAGRSVTIGGQVTGHVVAAGETVSISPAASVGDWAWLAGREINVAGRIGGELKAAGQLVVVSGSVSGDVELMAEAIRIPASARIDGNLVYRSDNEPVIEDGAVIGGDIIARPLPHREMEDRGGALFVLLALAVAAVVYYLVFPVFSVAAATGIGSKPLASLGTGAAFLFVTPFVILLLFVTVIGMLVALPLLAWYAVSLLAGLLTGVIFVGDAGLRLVGKGYTTTGGMRMLSIVLGLVALMVVQIIPVVGGLVMLVLFVLGLGALQLAAWRGYSQ